METTGFVGLGRIGSGIAAHIRQAGYPLAVYDIRPEAMRPFVEKGARPTASPAQVAGLSDVVFTSLPGPKEVEAVALGSQGLLEGIKRGSVYIDLSSSRPVLIRRIAESFRQKGAQVLDAPIIVGKKGVAQKDLQLMVGGEPQTYERVKPILDAFCTRVVYVGDVGTGSVIKLAHNMARRSVQLAIGEGVVLAAKAGVDPQVLWECLHWGLDVQLSQMYEGFPKAAFQGGDQGPAGFPLSLSLKDVSLATELAREHQVPMPFASLAEQVMMQAVNRGWAHKGTSALFVLQEEAAGVQVRVPAPRKKA